MAGDVTLGDLLVRYKADTSDLTTKMSQAKSSMSSANDTAQSSGGGIFGAFARAGSGIMNFAATAGLALQGMQNIANTALSLGQDLLGPAESAETMNSAFTTLLGSQKAANDEMAKLDAFASKTPFTTLDIDKAGSELIAFKTNASQVVPELTAIGDELGSVGRGTAANMDSIVNIFGKIRTEGKLTIGTMSELSINGIDAWSALERATGKTQAQLTTMISAGLIPAGTAIDDLTKGIEANPLYAGGMARQSNTMVGLISTLKSNWDQMLASFGSPILKELEPEVADIGNTLSSPGFKSFAGSVGQGIVNVFQMVGSVAQRAMPVLQGVGQLFLGMGDEWNEFASQLNTGGISAGFGSLKTAVSGLSSTFQLAGPFINNLDNALIDLAGQGAQLVGPSFQIMGQIITGANGALQGIILSVEGQFLPALQNVEHEVFPIVASFEIWIQKSNLIPIAFAGLKVGISLIIGGISLLLNIGAGLIHFFTQTEIGSALLKSALILVGSAFTLVATVAIAAFIASIPEMVTGFVAGAAGAWSMAAGVIALTWPILAVIAVIALIVLAIQHWSDITKFAQGAWGAFAGWLMGTLGKTGAFFTGVWHAAENDFNIFIHFLVSVGQVGFAMLLGVVFGPVIGIINLFKLLYDHNYYFHDLVDNIVKTFMGGFDWSRNEWSQFSNWSENLWDGMSHKAEDTFGGISNTVRQKTSDAGNWIQQNGSKASAWWNNEMFQLGSWTINEWSKIRAIFMAIWDVYIGPGLHSAQTGFTGWFTGLENQALSFGRNFVQGIINGISSMLGSLGNEASQAASVVENFLGFHSPAKAGPGSHLMEWGPGLVHGFGQSMIGALPDLQSSLNLVMQPVSSTFSSPARTVIASGGNNTPTNNVTHVHVHIGEHELATFLVDPMMEKVAKRIRLMGGKMVSI